MSFVILCWSIFFVSSESSSQNSKVSSSATEKTPLEVVLLIPPPPKTLAEALQRSGEEKDVLVEPVLDEIMAQLDQSTFSGEISVGTKNSITSIQYQEEQWREDKELQQLLDSTTGLPSQALLERIRIIGEEIDAQIKQCLQTKTDSSTACVERAEKQAYGKRRDASEEFLNHVNSRWLKYFERVKEVVRKRESRNPTRINGHASNIDERNRKNLWKLIERTALTVEEITRLSTQFTK